MTPPSENDVATLFATAVEYHTQGRLEDALRLYDVVIRLNPGVPDAHSNRGAALHSLKKFEEALESCNRAIALDPNFAAAHNNKGIAQLDLDRLDEALGSCNRAIALKPDYVDAHHNRGTALTRLNRFAEAIESYDRAIALSPDYADAYNNKGSAQKNLNLLSESLLSFERALELSPDFPEAHYNKGNSLRGLKRLDEAIQSYDKAIALIPNYEEAWWNKSQCLLALGRFAEGFRLYEHRKRIRSKMQNYPSYGRPLWLGDQSLAGKTLFISSEMLLGDMIQFSRYAKLAEAQGAKVIISAANSLRRLLGSLSPTIQIIAENTEPSDFDFRCPLMSLPLAFKTTLESIPSQVPYLHAEPERIQRWKERIGSLGFKIGICWQGSTTAVAAGRSFPLVELEGLSGIPHVRLISLQRHDGIEQLENLPAGMTVETLGDDFDAGPDAFVDAAAVMENLDLIITSDTAIAHLAGALARPTRVALKYVPDWRWLLERSDSPWYPTMRLFRQPSQDHWPRLFGDMKAELVKLVGSKPADVQLPDQ